VVAPVNWRAGTAPEHRTVAAAVARVAAAVLSKALAVVAAPQPAPARAAARVGEVVAALPEEEVVVDVAEEAGGGVGKGTAASVKRDYWVVARVSGGQV
jgi:hypothetical protein